MPTKTEETLAGQHPDARPTIAIRALGGTISMKSQGAGAAPVLGASSLVETAAGLDRIADVDAQTVRTIAGASLTISDLVALHEELERSCANGANGVVVIQGTDTLEETAYLLDLVWTRAEPLVLTGAMRTADAVGADGPANLLAAVTVAADPSAANRGALVVLSDEIHDGRFVRKTHTSRVAAFSSPSAGPAGVVHEGRAIFYRPASARRPLILAKEAPVPRIALVQATLGAESTLLEAAVESYDAIVVEALGGGHVPAWWVDPLTRAVERVPVVLASRTGSGHVLERTYDFPGSERGLLRAGLLPAGILDGAKARILTLALLMSAGDGSFDREAFVYHAGVSDAARTTAHA
jgi:L-asparaginase